MVLPLFRSRVWFTSVQISRPHCVFSATRSFRNDSGGSPPSQARSETGDGLLGGTRPPPAPGTGGRRGAPPEWWRFCSYWTSATIEVGKVLHERLWGECSPAGPTAVLSLFLCVGRFPAAGQRGLQAGTNNRNGIDCILSFHRLARVNCMQRTYFGFPESTRSLSVRGITQI